MARNDDDDDYPLNCVDKTSDGFSGWFAISHPRQCNDFCYWSNVGDEKDYTAGNTADPHRSTVVRTPGGATAYWTCVYDGAGDDTTVSAAHGERWDAGVPFPYLRCQKGAGERLSTWSGQVVQEASFWESWITVAALIYVGEILAFIFLYKRRGKLRRYTPVAGDSEGALLGGVDDEGASGGDYREGSSSSIRTEDQAEGARVGFGVTDDNDNDDSIEIECPGYGGSETERSSSSYNSRGSRCRFCAPAQKSQRALYVLRVMLVVAMNLLLAAIVSSSALSLMEINDNPRFTEGLQKMTPMCADPNLVCPAGNVDIDRASPPAGEGGWGRNAEPTPSGATRPAARSFSYILASDSQLYWFNGEFSSMGQRSVPPSCSPQDSCGSCTSKFGERTNRRLKTAWEGLMTDQTPNADSSKAPTPNTLVMNGDLTAYFHPYQRSAYESIYNNIKGLDYYFPSLGNHDIEHHSGSLYGGDQWGGLKNCNMEHAIGYFKGGFCGQIPAFDTERIVRFDSSSLAYSWNEGRYHFVHTHYYPTYEIASADYGSSLLWLERDLQIAHDAGLATVLFVHKVQGLKDTMQEVILGRNVKAIIAGHTHRCLLGRCEGVWPLSEEEVGSLDSNGIVAEKCIPAAYDTCEVLDGMNLLLAKDMEGDVSFPRTKLHNREDKPDKPLCPQPDPFYINKTENSLLCRRVLYSHPTFPFHPDHNATEKIPIFWSGSASFETFLRGDFYEDRLVFNALTVTANGEAVRYVDTHKVPNGVYPYHQMADLEERTIYL